MKFRLLAALILSLPLLASAGVVKVHLPAPAAQELKSADNTVGRMQVGSVRSLAKAGRSVSESGRRFALVTADPGLLRILEITGVDNMLAVHHSTESALAAPST